MLSASMSSPSRRVILKKTGKLGVAGAALGSVATPVSAHSKSVGVDADSGIGTGDSDNDGWVTIDPHNGYNESHEYTLTSIADGIDVCDCKDEETTTDLWQERVDCSTGDYYWEHIDYLTVTADCDDVKDSKTGNVSADGSGWTATGYYEIEVECCNIDDGNCYDWDKVCNKNSKQFQMDEDLGGCGGTSPD